MKYITAILVTLPFSALSATHCFYNLSNVDVCKQAAKMANEIKSDLPLNVSKDVSLYAVEVIGIGADLTTSLLPHHRTYGSVYGGSVMLIVACL